MTHPPRALAAAAVAALIGCAAEPDGSICRAGFSLAPDGHCYPPPPDARAPSIEDVLLGQPDCIRREATGEIDLTAGCADRACVGDDFATIDNAVGGFGSRQCIDRSSNETECFWGGVIGARFPSDPSEPDTPAAGEGADRIRLLSRYQGASADGLGTRIGTRCFVEVLGSPDLVVFENVEGSLLVSQIEFDRFGLVALDDDDGRGNEQPDGTIDELLILGAP